MKDNLLMIFVRNPILGKVKTRLAKEIGDEKALKVYKELLKHTRACTQNLIVDKFVFYDSEVDLQDSWSNEVYEKYLQSGDDLGQKMSNAFAKGFVKGYKSIIIIGSDCAEIDEEIIKEAFDSLTSNKFVIGPANDGGYYLLGMNNMHSEFFNNKKWSTDTVFRDTLQDIEESGFNFRVLSRLSDIDRKEDLTKFRETNSLFEL